MNQRQRALLVVRRVGGWMLVCAAILAAHWPLATPSGRALVTLEGLFVGCHAFVEYRVLLERSLRA